MGFRKTGLESIIQDRRGFIWLATRDGLNRFDGYEFITYNHEPHDRASLSNNSITALLEDQRGGLWIGTRSGLNRFDPTTERFKRYLHDPENPGSLSNNLVNHIHEDREGILWIATRGGLDRLDPATEVFRPFRTNPENPNSLADDHVSAVYGDRSGYIWIGTAQGLDRFNPDTGQFHHFVHDPRDPGSLASNFVWSIYGDHRGELWVGTREGLDRFDAGSEGFVHYNDTVWGLVSDIREDSEGRLWIGAASGLRRLDRDRSEFVRYVHDPLNPSTRGSNSIASLCFDSLGGLWVGTRGQGVNTWNPFRHKFDLQQSDPPNANSLDPSSVRAIYEDREGILWIGSDHGLDRVDQQANRVTRYVGSPQDPNALSDSNVCVIYADPIDDRLLWIGTQGGGLNRLDRMTGIFKQFRGSLDGSAGLAGRNIHSILQDRSGYLWVGTELGLNRFDPSSERFRLYRQDLSNTEKRSSSRDRLSRIKTIYIDRLDSMWIGTEARGLSRFDPTSETFTPYIHVPENPESLSSNSILTITEDRNGKLWIGTNGGGLNRLDRDSGTFVRYTKNNGLPNNVIYGILEDSEGVLWLSTNHGISRFDPVNKTFRNYDVDDGLQSDRFDVGAYHKSRSGELFFGGTGGLNRFYPHLVVDDPNVPSIVITDLRLFNRSVPIGEYERGRAILETTIAETRAVDLTYRENVISLQFAALHYTAPEKNRYAYIMEGLEQEWNYVGDRRFATYSGLSPGDYVFRVKASNSDGIWNEEGTSLRITITPPFWGTWWFRQLAIAAIVLSALGAYKVKTLTYRRRTQVLVRLNAQLEAQVAERRRAERALRASERLYRGLIEDQTELVCRWRPDGTRTFVNDACCKYFGQPREELLGSSVFDTISEQGREAFCAKIELLTPDRPAATAEHPVLRQRRKSQLDRVDGSGDFRQRGTTIGIPVGGTGSHRSQAS